jgi:hypothetical protein
MVEVVWAMGRPCTDLAAMEDMAAKALDMGNKWVKIMAG